MDDQGSCGYPSSRDEQLSSHVRRGRGLPARLGADRPRDNAVNCSGCGCPIRHGSVRQFTQPFPLARLSLEARVLYSSFLIFVLVGVGSSAWLYRDNGFGLGSEEVVRYFHGDEATGLPAPADDAAMHMEKSARQVVETLHFHAFTMPVVLLIVGHLFMMCALSTRKKIGVLVTAATTTLLHLLLPPLVSFASAGFAALFGPSAIVMSAAWLVLLVWPLVEMWRPSSSLSSD